MSSLSNVFISRAATVSPDGSDRPASDSSSSDFTQASQRIRAAPIFLPLADGSEEPLGASTAISILDDKICRSLDWTSISDDP